MTLLEELAKMEHDRVTVIRRRENAPSDVYKDCKASCTRCRLEKWAREKAKEWQGGHPPMEDWEVWMQCARELVGGER